MLRRKSEAKKRSVSMRLRARVESAIVLEPAKEDKPSGQQGNNLWLMVR
jgi:hypothetical protein